MKKRLFGIMSAAVIAAVSVPTAEAATLWKMTGEEKQGDFLCREYGQGPETGTHEFIPDASGLFSLSWDGVFSYGAEQSRTFGAPLNWDRYNFISQSYEADINLSGNDFFGVHGWTQQEIAEYFIVEGWGSWRPPGATPQGQVIDNGQIYDIFVSRRLNYPYIEGTISYDQLWSVRRTSSIRMDKENRIFGEVDVAKHFQAWADSGIIKGSLCPETCGLYVEAYGGADGNSSGLLEVNKNEFSYSVAVVPSTEPVLTEEPVCTITALPEQGLLPVDEDGVFFRSDFEFTADGWWPRNMKDYSDPSQRFCDEDYYVTGEHSLRITNREAVWGGACRSLEEYALEYGSEYKLQAAVMQNSESIETFRLELEYKDGAGEPHYEQIAEKQCRKGEWTVIGDTFRFPAEPGTFDDPEAARASMKNVRIYVTTEDTACDFWLDSVILSEKDADVTVDLSRAVPAPKPAVTPKLVQYPARDSSASYRAHQNKDYTYMGGGTGFKDILGPYFRIGATLSAVDLQDANIRDFYLKNFNSVTCENEMKPDSILASIGTDDVTVSLKNAAGILKFAEANGIGLRGHNFVWYSQTPSQMFAGTPEESDARIESMIRQTFEQLKTNYPDLKLYAYDVCNEVFKNNGGGLRVTEGDMNSISGYAKVYGEDNPEFILNAFKWAREYAPAGCKLYLNEYNEYTPEKCDDLCRLAKLIMKEGDYIDGIGMQSHLDTEYPDKTLYESAVKEFAALGLDIQITELEITDAHNSKRYEQRALWSDIFRIALNYADNISSVTLWEPVGTKWRTLYQQHENSLFRSDMEPLPAYYDILDLTEEIAPPVTTEVPIARLDKPADYQPLTTRTETTAVPAAARRGDANCDSYVDISDAVLILRYAASDAEAVISDQGVKNGDADGNGQTDSADATMILRFIAKQITL